jgi:hypothetical protein
MNQISLISRVTDAQAARIARPGTMAELAAEIAATPVRTPPASPRRARASRQSSWRRRWLIGVPLAAGLAAVILIATSLGHPGQQVGPVRVGPPPAQALSFTRHGGYLTVIVRDPLADPSRYRAEFARYHLNISLRLVPVSPSLVGSVTSISESAGSNITPITAEGRCHIASGGDACPVGVRIPADFSGSAQVVFGRAARPGEQFQSAASAFAPGEAMHGMLMQIKQGRTVAQVLAMLRQRDVTVPIYTWSKQGRQVPRTWYVYDAVPWAPQQVMLFVGPAWPPPPGSPTP